METERICQECGAPLTAEAPEGLCPKCLMKVALGTQAGAPPGGAGEPTAGKGGGLPDPARLAQLFPQLEILELLGQGGMGAVYKARQPALDRLVALKILPQQIGGDAGFAERFNREARALARLNHPNIIGVYDFGQVEQVHYFIMEYVDGANLRQIEQAGKLSPRQALQIIPQICEALQFAHDAGVVHRDIKPENVLLDKKGRVKIADFGLAKILGQEPTAWRLTGARDIMGTPHYMAPEQVEHPQAVDHRADLYSVGVVFYEMLTGELPLGKFAPPSRKVQVDVRLDEVVLHALEKEPQRRYQQASQIKTDVETIAHTAGARPTASPSATEAARAQAAWRQVKGPAIGLVVTGLLNWVGILFALLIGAFVVAAQDSFPRWVILLPSAALVLSSLILLAGVKLKNLEGYWLAVVGSVLAVLVAPGNLVGLPVGIWALAVLTRREVRAAFRLKARDGLTAPPPLPATGGAWKSVAIVVGALMLLLAIPVGAILASMVIPAVQRARRPALVQPRLLVSGSVRDAATGRPILGARVADNSYGARSDRAPQEAWTDPAGHYHLRTWNEEHTLTASAPGYQNQVLTLRSQPAGAQSAEIEFRLTPEAKPPAPAEDPSQPPAAAAPSVLTAPPVVVRTVPESGAAEVDPALREVQVTFSKPMKPGNWAWCYESRETFPSLTGQPRFLADGCTCVAPVQLQPGKVYALWLNSETNQDFQDRDSHPAVPYLLIFKTREGGARL